jgi:signal transduction histidine kinase
VGSPNLPELRVASIVLAVLFVLAYSTAFADNARQGVILFLPFDSGGTDQIATDGAFRRALAATLGEKVDVYTEFLDIQRFPEPKQQDRLAAYLHDKFAGRPIDLVVAGGSPSIRFLAPRHDALFPNSRLMFVAASQSRDLHLLGPDIPGLTTQFDPVPTVRLALGLEPNADRLIVVNGNNQDERGREVAARRDLNALSSGIKIEYWSGRRQEDILQAAAKLPPRTLVLYFSFGNVSASRDMARRLAAAASVPVYSQFDDYSGLGVVGGGTTTYDDLGREMGELAVRILTQHVSGIRVSSAATNIVDWRQLQRWGLSEANLPPGTIVRFREPSLWEEHKWLVMGSVAVLIVQSILITMLIIQARRRQRAQAALEQQQQELTHLGRVATLGELSGAIAHEINNPLSAILSNAQAAARFLDRNPIDTDELRAINRDIAADSKRAGEVIRRLRALFKKAEMRLEPVNLNEIVADGLELANRKLLEGNITVATKLANDVPEVRADPVQLKQVLLNIIVNACDAMEDSKHDDRRLTIATSQDQGVAQLSVTDRGSGISESVKERLFQPFVTTKSSGTGLGLSICRSIVEAHGGRLWASNNKDQGATFFVTLPAASA